MKLDLKRPLVIFDLESTGLSVTEDRIVEIAYLRISPNGEEKECCLRINPERKISEEAIEVHHITDEMVRDCPTFAQVANQIGQDFWGADIAGFNSWRYDLPLLIQEFYRVGIDGSFLRAARHVDIQTIFHKQEPRDLSAAYKFYCGKDHIDAHSALGDVIASYEVLQSQLDKYKDDLKNNVEFLSEFTAEKERRVDSTRRMIYNEKGVIVFYFGKYKGKPVEEVLRNDPGYYGWVMNGNFPADFKHELTRIKFSLK